MSLKKLAVCLAMSLSTAYAAETIPGTTLSIGFEAAQVQGAGRGVNIYRVPVTDVTTGVTTFYDASFQFGVLPDGSIGFTRTTSAAVSTSQLKAADNFVAGVYKDAIGQLYQLDGPVVLAGGRYQYSIKSLTAGKQFDATWITGAVTGHPQVGSFATRPTEGSAGAFGLLGVDNFGLWGGNNYNCGGYAVGASQLSPSSLAIYRFHITGCGSSSSATATVNLTKN